MALDSSLFFFVGVFIYYLLLNKKINSFQNRFNDNDFIKPQSFHSSSVPRFGGLVIILLSFFFFFFF